MRIRPLLTGSGKLGPPCARTHWENLSACVLSCCRCATDGPLPPFVSRCRHAFWAAWTLESLAPSCCDVSLDLSNAPLLLGSGQFGTPWERMQEAKATGPLCCVTSVAGEPPQAAASASPPAAISAAAVTEAELMASPALS